ncbi:MAG TPA: GNAT family N-acetyltransferase [Dysgonomonas sp.]|nr:GNAT family N-acetyltransferase [Dysgonomonas sp.]
MELESERLQLKEITWEDIEDIHRLYSCPEVDEFNTMGIPDNIDKTEEMIRGMIDAQKGKGRKSFTWKIISKDSGQFIGTAGISLSGDRFMRGEIFYELFPSVWGKGYATETARTMVKAGFEIFRLHRVEAGVATENIRSIHVLEKCGMTREGTGRKILPIRGKWVDNYHYAIVEDDPRDY